MPLTSYFHRLIEVEGPITVARFMQDALLHPTKGYYSTRDPFGEAGDFITAPEVSQMFGELIGLWCAQCWLQMGEPTQVSLVELGPGRGLLMADMLRATKKLPAFHAALSVHLVEASDKLRAIQAQELSQYDVAWHDHFADVPAGPLLLIANEFFDALAIRQFECHENFWHERLVTWQDEGLAFALSPEMVTPPTPNLQPTEGDIFEYSPSRDDVAREIGNRLDAFGGYALIIDYGHMVSGYGDTLQAIAAHEFAPVLARPGRCDLTSHVDFERLAAISPCRSWPAVTQGQFLEALGIKMRAKALQSDAVSGQIAPALERLTGTGQMGELFKVLALGHPDATAPAGFEEPQ